MGSWNTDRRYDTLAARGRVADAGRDNRGLQSSGGNAMVCWCIM